MDGKISRQKASDNVKLSPLIKNMPLNASTLAFNIDLETAFEGAEVTYNPYIAPTIIYDILGSNPMFRILTEKRYHEEDGGFRRETDSASYDNGPSEIEKKLYKTPTLSAIESMSTGDIIYNRNGHSFSLLSKIFTETGNDWSCELSGNRRPGLIISPIDQTSFILAAKRDDIINTLPKETILNKTYEQRPDGLFEVSIKTRSRTLKIDGIDFARVFRCCQRLDHFVFDDERYMLELKFIDQPYAESPTAELLLYPV